MFQDILEDRFQQYLDPFSLTISFFITVQSLLYSTKKKKFFFLKTKFFIGTELFGMNPRDSGMPGLSSSSFLLSSQRLTTLYQ